MGWGSSSGAALQSCSSGSLALGLTRAGKCRSCIAGERWARGSGVMPCSASPLQTRMSVPTAATAVHPSEPQIKVAKTQNKGCYSAACTHAFSSDRLLVGMARKKIRVGLHASSCKSRTGLGPQRVPSSRPQTPPKGDPASAVSRQDSCFRWGRGRDSKRALCWVSNSYQTAGGSTA